MVRVPQYISRPLMVIWFELDDIMVFMIPIALWMIINFSFILALGLAIGAMIYYRRVKRTAARGVLYHIYYMLGGRFNGFQSVHTRSYRE